MWLALGVLKMHVALWRHSYLLTQVRPGFLFWGQNLTKWTQEYNWVGLMMNINIAVCKTKMPAFPNIRRVGLTFDLDLLPTDLNVHRDHLLIKDYLPTKFEASGAKCSRVIRCTRFERLTWPLTLDLVTWLSIGIIYSSRTIYLPSLKFLGQSVVELSVAQGLEDWHDLWPWPCSTVT